MRCRFGRSFGFELDEAAEEGGVVPVETPAVVQAETPAVVQVETPALAQVEYLR